MYLQILAIIFVCIFPLYLLQKRRNIPPGPFGLPIIGSLLQIDPLKPYKSLMELSKKYGSIYGMYLGSVYTVVISDETIIRNALSNEDFNARAPLYVTHGIMGGYGLICAEGELWKDQRKLAIQFLKKLGMVKMENIRGKLESKIMNEINECLRLLNEKSTTTTTFDPFEILHHTLGNIMNRLVFGITYNFDDKTWHYLKNLQEEGVKYLSVSGIVNFLPWLRFLPSNRKILYFLLNGKETTHRIYDELIKKTKQKLKENTDDPSIIDLFLMERNTRAEENDEKLKFCSDNQLRHLLADLFGAGVDTTLTTIRWFLLFLSNKHGIQEKLRQEIVQNTSGDYPTLNDLNNCHYLKACIAEAQRIRSVVPLGIPHGTSCDSVLNGMNIPKGTMIIPLQWAVHMNSNHWNNPDEFNPKRFINDSGEFFTPAQFIPFQTGKRICLGELLAKMLLLLYCGHIVRHFRMSSELDGEKEYGNCGITLTPPNYTLTIQKIDYK